MDRWIIYTKERTKNKDKEPNLCWKLCEGSLKWRIESVQIENLNTLYSS